MRMLGIPINVLLFCSVILLFLHMRNTSRKGLGIWALCCVILVFLSMCDTDGKDLGNGFDYSSEHKHITGKIDIPPTIIWYDYDKYFIVAKQKPKKFHDAIYDKKEYVYPLGRDTIYYWLIIKQEQKVFGPLGYDSFQQLRKEYEVPDKLMLE